MAHRVPGKRLFFVLAGLRLAVLFSLASNDFLQITLLLTHFSCRLGVQ
jgi:hypothetical protein